MYAERAKYIKRNISSLRVARQEDQGRIILVQGEIGVVEVASLIE